MSLASQKIVSPKQHLWCHNYHNTQAQPAPRIPLASAPKALQWTCAQVVSRGMTTPVSFWKSAPSTPDEFDGNNTGVLHFAGPQGLTSESSQPIPMTMCQATVANASATSRVQLCNKRTHTHSSNFQEPVDVLCGVKETSLKLHRWLNQNKFRNVPGINGATLIDVSW